MGAVRFTIEFVDQPNIGDRFALDVYYNGMLIDTFTAYFSDFPGYNIIVIGANLAETIDNTASWFLGHVISFGIDNAVGEVDGLNFHMTYGNDLVETTGVFNGTDEGDFVQNGTYPNWGLAFQFPYSYESGNVTFNDAIVLSRSPYWFRYSPGVAYDRMVLRLYLYAGHKVDDKPASPTYTLSKYVVQAGQPTIGFDIAQLLNDRVQNSITTIGQEGSFSVDFKDTVWCYAEADVYLADDLLFTIEQQILAVDGFGYHTELINPEIPTPILTSNTHHVIYNNEDYPIYFLTDALDDIEVNGQTITFAYDTNLSTQNIGYINLAAYHDGDASFTAVFTYGEDVYTHTVERRVECRYDVLNCVFKNKYGFWQSMAFSKLSKNDYSRTSQNYQKVISNFGQYSLSSHSKRDYLTSLSQKITANTDFLPESQNELIKELLLSEFVYLKVDGLLLPVNITSNSWAEKTSHINKLIQYTMEFTISHDLMNNVK